VAADADDNGVDEVEVVSVVDEKTLIGFIVEG
jgi:hypothetical protein